jgi:Icc protein
VILETELPQAPDGSVRLLQITDTHLFASAEGRLLAGPRRESGRRAERVQANEHPFDLILATGDLSQDHSPESYQRFASMMAPWLAPSTGCPATTTTAP